MLQFLLVDALECATVLYSNLTGQWGELYSPAGKTDRSFVPLTRPGPVGPILVGPMGVLYCQWYRTVGEWQILRGTWWARQGGAAAGGMH